MLKQSLLVLALAASSFTASADNWVGSIGYSNLSDDLGSDSISLSTVNIDLGYKFNTSENVSVTPRLGYGFGVDDEQIFGVKVRVKRFLTVAVRGQYQWDSNWYAYAEPTYANLEVQAKKSNIKATADDWEFGGEVGFGYAFDNVRNVELSYGQYDGTDVLSVAYSFNF